MIMQNWEKKEQTSKRIALIVSICLHIALLISLTAYSSSGKDGSFLDWAKQIFKSEQVEHTADTDPSA